MGNFILSSILKNYDFYSMSSVWQQWETLSDKDAFKLSKTVKHKKNTSILGQFHQTMRVENLQACLKMLQFRKTFRNSSIVGIYGVYLPSSQQSNNFTFCGQLQNYSLVTQHVPFCFSDIGLIEFSNGIYILKKTLSAAKLIKQKLNLTTLYDENMIFFDKQNNCKIWINEDISNNQVMNQNQVSESQSILSIFMTVQSKINYSLAFENYRQMRSQFQLTNFMQAINFVNNFQSEILKLTNYQNSFTTLDLHEKNQDKISSVKTQKIKKSLSSRKKILEIKNDPKFSSMRKNNPNFYNESDHLSIKFENNQTISSKFKQNIPSNILRNLQSQNQKKLQLLNFLKEGKQKKQQLKKQRIKRNEVKQKYIGLTSVDISMIQKPLSTVSTNQQSFDNQSNFRPYNNNYQNSDKTEIQDRDKIKNQVKNSTFLSPRTLNMKTQISNVSFLTNYNLNQKNGMQIKQKLSISEYNSKMKKNVSLPVFFKSKTFVCS